MDLSKERFPDFIKMALTTKESTRSIGRGRLIPQPLHTTYSRRRPIFIRQIIT